MYRFLPSKKRAVILPFLLVATLSFVVLHQSVISGTNYMHGDDVSDLPVIISSDVTKEEVQNDAKNQTSTAVHDANVKPSNYSHWEGITDHPIISNVTAEGQKTDLKNQTNQTANVLDVKPLASSPTVAVKSNLPNRTPTAASCRRRCSHYRNRIVITAELGGLGDRMVMMGKWADMALFLCARVHLTQPPFRMLHPRHAPGEQQLILNTTFQDDFIYWVDADSSNEIILSDLVVPGIGAGKNFRVTSDPKTVVGDFFKVYNFAERQQRGETDELFRWNVNGRFWHYDDKISSTMEQLKVHSNVSDIPPQQLPRWSRKGAGCNYAKMVIAETNRNTSRRVLSRLKERFGAAESDKLKYGYMHVRRGDAKKSCDSELTKMKRYLNCTFFNFCRDDASELPHCKSRFPLLIGSDELNQTYRRGLFDLVDAHPKLKAVDMEELIQYEIKREIAAGESYQHKLNNYAVFLIERDLMPSAKHGSFMLQQDRSRCTDCDADRVRVK